MNQVINNQIPSNELFDVFPEGRAIVHEKITEYEQDRAHKLGVFKDFYGQVQRVAKTEHKDDFFVWFWSDLYIKTVCVPQIAQVDNHLFRLKQLVGSPSSGTRESWESIKERARLAPLETVATPYLHKMRHQGTQIQALCPFHVEKSPSFVIYTDSNSFYCFGCGKHGDSITFLMDIEQIDFKTAVRRLAHVQ